MKTSILISLLAMATVYLAQGQGAGGGGRGGGGAAGVYQTPGAAPVSPALQRERSKRGTSLQEQKDTNSTYVVIDASVLMNVKADGFVAVFGIVKEATTVNEATTKMDATIASFKDALKSLGVPEGDEFVDFVIQNRIYAYVSASATNAPVSILPDDVLERLGSARFIEGTTAREVLVGYEVKRNFSIHYRDRSLFEKLVRAAARLEIYDLVKVDCVVRDIPAVHAKLREEAARIIKDKSSVYKKLGVPLSDQPQVVRDTPSIDCRLLIRPGCGKYDQFMKNSLKVSVLLSLLAMPGLVQAQFTWTTNSGTITITQYTGPGGAVVIPGTITGLPVTTIGNYAFTFCTSLTGIKIPDSVISIGSGAFHGCTRLANLTIPSSVTHIGGSAFYSCSSLTSVAIPGNVTDIGNRAFMFCTGLTRVTVGSGVTRIEALAFSDCTSLKGVYFQGNAPSLDLESSVFSGDSTLMVYRLAGATGWGARFGGRPTAVGKP